MTPPIETAKRLTILDLGLFQVHENGRVIGIPGYLIETHQSQFILVDTGFPAKYAADASGATIEDGLDEFGVVLDISTENLCTSQLSLIGLQPADIDWLVLTHSDIDHIGQLDEFPEATLVIGSAERALPEPRYFKQPSPIQWPENMVTMLVDTDQKLAPGVEILQTPGHSPGHLSLLVRLVNTGNVILTADAIARPSELEKGFEGAWEESLAWESARRLVHRGEDESAMIIYGHDPAQWDGLRKAPAFYD